MKKFRIEVGFNPSDTKIFLDGEDTPLRNIFSYELEQDAVSFPTLKLTVYPSEISVTGEAVVTTRYKCPLCGGMGEDMPDG